MYRSPIELRIRETVQEELDAQDNVIMHAVREIIPDIDKDELIRALEYDRAQYEKGYFEGKEAAKAERRWIPVTERLPELIPCSAGTAYSETVNVLTSGRKVLTAIWDGTDFIADAEFWEADGEEITHWTPVLLPLPAPPEGD